MNNSLQLQLQFPESMVKIGFCSQGNKQKILIDVLSKYSGMDLKTLASHIDVSEEMLKDICEGDAFLVGEQADSLAHLFLVFFGGQFFRQGTLIRN